MNLASLLAAINHHNPGRELATSDIVVALTCDHCRQQFPGLPHEQNRDRRIYCYKHECRRAFCQQRAAGRRHSRTK